MMIIIIVIVTWISDHEAYIATKLLGTNKKYYTSYDIIFKTE